MLTEIITWRESPVLQEWFATPSYSCLDAKPQLVKRLQRPHQPPWIGRMDLGSTSLSLLSSTASHTCLASKLLSHSCDNEDSKQIMWVGWAGEKKERKKKKTERVKWANQMYRVHGSILSCSFPHGCHVYTTKPEFVIFLESGVYRFCCWSKE